MILAFFLVLSSPQAPAQDFIRLVRGQKSIVSIPKSGTIYVGNGDVISAKEVDAKLIISAKKIGRSKLLVGQNEWNFMVMKREIFEAHKELKPLIAGMTGLSLEADENSCLIEGRLLRWADLVKISKVQRKFRETCSFQAEVVPEKKQYVFDELIKLARAQGLMSPELDLANATVKIPINLKKNEKAYQKIYKPLGFNVELTNHIFEIEQTIVVKLYLVEASRSFTQSLGLSWMSELGAVASPKLTYSGGIGFQLNALESQGQGRILAAPTLISRSGGTSNFFAGGEVPLRTSGYHKRSEIVWKSYGIKLDISPTADWQGTIKLKLSTEVSSLDQSVSVDNLPGFKTNKLEAEFNVQSGQLIALSGLIKATDGNDASGLPYLKRIPFLGKLFRSDNFLNQRSELLILVAPEILANTNEPSPKFTAPSYEMINADSH